MPCELSGILIGLMVAALVLVLSWRFDLWFRTIQCEPWEEAMWLRRSAKQLRITANEMDRKARKICEEGLD